MKVFCVMITEGDGCSYSCETLHKIYARYEDAKTEVARIEILQAQMMEAKRHGILDMEKFKDDFRFLGVDVDIEEQEVL